MTQVGLSGAFLPASIRCVSPFIFRSATDVIQLLNGGWPTEMPLESIQFSFHAQKNKRECVSVGAPLTQSVAAYTRKENNRNRKWQTKSCLEIT